MSLSLYLAAKGPAWAVAIGQDQIFGRLELEDNRWRSLLVAAIAGVTWLKLQPEESRRNATILVIEDPVFVDAVNLNILPRWREGNWQKPTTFQYSDLWANLARLLTFEGLPAWYNIGQHGHVAAEQLRAAMFDPSCLSPLPDELRAVLPARTAQLSLLR